jgi:hypothetical protein
MRVARSACDGDAQRVIGQRTEPTGALMAREREQLRGLPEDGFDIAESSCATVDNGACVTVRTNRYSTPLRPSTRSEAKLYPAYVEIWHEGKRVACHERCYSRRQQILDLEHYLEPLSRKPGALAGSTALAQWRQQGRWTDNHDRLWEVLNARHGRQTGTRLMVDVIMLGREHGYGRLQQTIQRALTLGCSDAEAIRYLLLEPRLERPQPQPFAAGPLSAYDRPLPTLSDYDLLACRGGCADFSNQAFRIRLTDPARRLRMVLYEPAPVPPDGPGLINRLAVHRPTLGVWRNQMRTRTYTRRRGQG